MSSTVYKRLTQNTTAEIAALDTGVRHLTKLQRERGAVFADDTSVVITAIGPVKYKSYCRYMKHANVGKSVSVFPFLNSEDIGRILYLGLLKHFDTLEVRVPTEGIDKQLRTMVSQNLFTLYYNEATGIIITRSVKAQCVTYTEATTYECETSQFNAYRVEENMTYMELFASIVDKAHEWTMERYIDIYESQPVLLVQLETQNRRLRFRKTSAKRKVIKRRKLRHRSIYKQKQLETKIYEMIKAAVNDNVPLQVYNTYKMDPVLFQEKIATLTPEYAVEFIMALVVYGYLAITPAGKPIHPSKDMVIRYASYQGEMYMDCARIS